MSLERRTEWLEQRPGRAPHLATGSLACPACDAPPLLAGPVPLSSRLECGWCGREGTVRDFLSLGEPTRPARVTLRARVIAPAAAPPAISGGRGRRPPTP